MPVVFGALAVFLLAAKWWAPRFQELGGRSLFLASDAMMAGGLAIVFAFLCQKALPDRIIRSAEKIPGWARKHFRILSALFLTILLALLYFINQRVLHAFMNSADEHACYFLAQCLRMGKWWVAPHPLADFFQVVHVGNRDGKWFSVYPPGWPVLLALGLSWNVADWLNPLLSTAALIFLFKAGEKVVGFSAAALGLALMALTPYFLFTGAAYFSHPTCLLMTAIFLYASLRWLESHSTPNPGTHWAGLAAFALGYGLNTRYLTMTALAAPFVGFHIWQLLSRRVRWNRSDTVFAAILLVMTGFVFAHNFIVTGDFTEPPNHYDKRWERLGFRGDYSVLDGMIYILARFLFLSQWVPFAFLGLFLYFLFEKRRLEPIPQLYRFGFFYLAVAYFFYYSWGGNQYGPRYYYEGLPFLAFATAEGFRHRWKQASRASKKFLLGVVLFAIPQAGYQAYKQGVFHEAASRERKALYELAEKTLTRPSIVFIRGFLGDTLVLSEEDAVRNAPALNAKILYAHDLGDKNRLLKEYYPDRETFRGTFDRTLKQPKLEKI